MFDTVNLYLSKKLRLRMSSTASIYKSSGSSRTYELPSTQARA